MVNEDPAGFSPEDTQSIPIVLPLAQALEGLRPKPCPFELEIPDEADWKIMPLEEAESCGHPHYDPNRQSLVGNDGPSLWFVSGYGPDGTGCTLRVDNPDSHLFGDDRSDTDYRNRLLLKALLHTALGLLEGGDYS